MPAVLMTNGCGSVWSGDEPTGLLRGAVSHGTQDPTQDARAGVQPGSLPELPPSGQGTDYLASTGGSGGHEVRMPLRQQVGSPVVEPGSGCGQRQWQAQGGHVPRVRASLCANS